MKGIDLFDQYIGYYESNHKSKRWYIRFYHYILEWAMRNANVLFNKTHNKKVKSLDFRIAVIKGLLTDWKIKHNIPETKIRPKKKVPQPSTVLCVLDHANSRYLRCRECPSRTSFWCKTHEMGVCAAKCYDKHRIIYEQSK